MLSNVSDLDLRLIRVFLAVADAYGVSAAQARLNVGQSTISTQLATLETRLGYKLCERGRAGFRLTAKGEKFAAAARRMLEALAEFGIEARNLDRKLVGSLSIGLMGHTPSSENTRLSDTIRRFRDRDEAVRLNLVVRTPGELEDMLLNGSLQLAIGYFWRRVPSLAYLPLMQERQVAYCAASHPLHSRAGGVAPDEALAHQWAWRGYPVPAGMAPVPRRQVTALTGNMEAMAILILSGRHLGYLPEEIGQGYVERGLMAALNPAQLSYEVTIHAVSSRAQAGDELLDAFMEDLGRAQQS